MPIREGVGKLVDAAKWPSRGEKVKILHVFVNQATKGDRHIVRSEPKMMPTRREMSPLEAFLLVPIGGLEPFRSSLEAATVAATMTKVLPQIA